MRTNSEPCRNHLLCALTETELASLAPDLELVNLSQSEVLYEANEKLQYIYFPNTTTASLLCLLEDGVSVEVANVGNEGLIGFSAIIGRNETLTQAIVNVEGSAYRMSIKALRNVLARSDGRRAGKLKMLMLRYAQNLFLQMSQFAACNRRHSTEQQLSCWLLTKFDRINSNRLIITQEAIAFLLGVRRETITEMAKRLQNAGLIEYRRGEIDLINREQLEKNACECYQIIKETWAINTEDLKPRR